MLNIGGVANVTFIDGEDLIACDTGPGNALLDDFLRLRTGKLLDTDGRAAAAGVVDETAVARVLAHPFFGKPPPKSLDRNDFRGWVGAALDDRSVEDGAATLTALQRQRSRASCRCCRARRKPGSSPAAARATRR